MKITFEAKNIIESKNFYEFGKVIDEGLKLKKKFSSNISNEKINLLYDKAIKNGAVGGKLLGAGGGGFLLFFVPKEKKNH